MIAKIIKGAVFKNLINYIFDNKKGAKLLSSEGIRTQNNELISLCFQYQAQLNQKVEKPVGHIALGFSAQDHALLNDDMMTKIALEYMYEMGIRNTQYIIGRHFDKEHPHLHIAYNRVNNDGITISDKNDRYRSEKICKELTKKYCLYYATGKENVKTTQLKEPDKTKFEIYMVIKNTLPYSTSWRILIENLEKSNIQVQFKYKRHTNEIQGVTFIKNGLSYRGSKIDQAYSFSKIDNVIKSNSKTTNLSNNENPVTPLNKSFDEHIAYSSALPLNHYSDKDETPQNKKKKRKRNIELNR